MKIDPFPGTLTRSDKNGHPYVLTDEQKAWFRRWFPEVENSRLMKMSGMSHSTLHRFARDLGLAKSEAGLHGIMKRQGQKVKRICEKNGYYDSLRGKPPSEASRKATAQMWQDIRDGKREHPTLVMKRENPRKYRQWMKRKSEERKEIIRKEKMRLTYGLARQTNIKVVVLQPYTRRQLCHRHNAFKRGYILMEDCSEGSGERWNIYYDNETQRGERFEQNLKKDGFNVKEWKD